jgi:hypothetical protein
MRGFIKVLVDILVTSLASLGAGILARRLLCDRLLLPAHDPDKESKY